MANALYDTGREGFLDGSIDWDTNTIKDLLRDEGADAYNAADDNLDDISAGRVGTDQTIGSKTVTAGVADGGNLTHTAVSGASVESIDIYKDTGTPSTSRLICNIDTATGLPVTPNGGDITITWDDGANKIFKL